MVESTNHRKNHGKNGTGVWHVFVTSAFFKIPAPYHILREPIPRARHLSRVSKTCTVPLESQNMIGDGDFGQRSFHWKLMYQKRANPLYFRKGGVGLSFLDILPFFGRNRRAISRNFPLSFELRGRVSLCALLARKTSHFGFSKIATFPKANQLAQFFPLED